MKEKIKAFWNWFEKNNHDFLFLNEVSLEEKDRLLDCFIGELHKVSDGLYFSIGGFQNDYELELVITAEGDINYFQIVEDVVDNAPKVPNWKFVKFKQPHGPGFVTKYRGHEFDPNKIIFIPLINNGNPKTVGIQVCYPNYSEELRSILLNGTYIMLDALIGEKSTSLDIDYLDVVETPNNIDHYDFKHLSDLETHIREIKREYN